MLTILPYRQILNFAKTDDLTISKDVSSQYTVKMFTNFGADDQSLVPGKSVTEEVSISNLGNYDAYARLYLQSIFDVTNSDSVKDIVTAQTAEKVLTGTISYKFVRRNAVDTD